MNVLCPLTNRVSIIKSVQISSLGINKIGSERNLHAVPQEVIGQAQLTLDKLVTLLIKLHCRFRIIPKVVLVLFCY